MVLFCCERHNDKHEKFMEKVELREVHILFEILEEAVRSRHVLKEIRDLLKASQPVPVEARLVIPVGVPEPQ